MEQLVFAGGPWWLYVLLAIVAGAIATISYRRTTPELSPPSKWILVALRTIGIAALLIALFEPIMRFVNSETMRPHVVFAVDRSHSMQLLSERAKQGSDKATRRQGDKASLNEIANEIASELGADEMFVFSDRAQQVNGFDTVRFNGQRTDIASVMTMLSNRKGMDRPAVVVLLTDGNTNTGENPIYVAEKAGLGVYTIGVGDSVPPKDAGVTSLVTAGIATKGKPINVAISVRMSELQNVPVVVVLEDEGKEVGRDTVQTSMRDGRVTSDISWTPQVDGIRTLTARVLPTNGEHTTANNALREQVEVRTDQRTIVLFAGAPSPDVAFIRSVLERDPSIKVTTFIQKQGALFYEGTVPQNVFDNAVACVFIGFPNASSPDDVLRRVAARCEKGLALLFIPSKETSYARLAPFENVIPFRVATSRPNEMLITPDVSSGATADPLLKISGDENDAQLWNTLPPIWRTETFVNPAPGAVTLAKIRTGNVPVDQPLVIKRETGETRSVAVMGYGLYRWKLLGEGPQQARGVQTTDVFGSFVNNCISWLSVRQDERRIRIRATRQRYAAGEPVEFTASILDESFAPITGADVRIMAKGRNGEKANGRQSDIASEYALTELGGGRYSAVVGPMPEGEYTCVGTAQLNNVIVGTDNSRFSVGALGLEEASTSMNTDVLTSLAHRTGGVFAHESAWQRVVEAAKNDQRLRPLAITSERDVILWHLPWLLIVALASFTAEWVLRKRRGLV